MLYFGSAIFKIARLLFIFMLCVHIFACIYYRVKLDTTLNPNDVEEFYASNNVSQNVSSSTSFPLLALCYSALIRAFWLWQELARAYVRLPARLLYTHSRLRAQA